MWFAFPVTNLEQQSNQKQDTQNNMKTIKEHLNDLKEPERTEALKAMVDWTEDDEHQTLADALYCAFTWSEYEPNRPRYWCKIHEKLEAGTYFDAPQLTEESCKDKSTAFNRAHLKGSGRMPAHAWFKYLNAEHREAAMELENDMGVEGGLFESLQDALYSKDWCDDSKFYWSQIHTALVDGSYHERPATDADMQGMEGLIKESICQEAQRIQGGDRQQDYGSPTKNFQDIADLWSTYIKTACGVDVDLKARDVAHMSILMKISRNVHKPKRDNWVDMAGYAQCGGKVDEL